MITDPEELAGTILAADLLLGRDAYGKRNLTHVRRVSRRADSTSRESPATPRAIMATAD